jgi:hypothetical protein
VDMTPVLQALCAWGVVAMLAAALRMFVAGTGNPGWIARIGIVRLVVMAPLLFVAAHAFESMVVVALLISVEVAIEVLVILRLIRRRLHVETPALWRALDGLVLAAGGAGLAALGGRLLADGAGAGAIQQLVLGAVLGVVAYAGLIALLERPLLSRGVDLFRRATGSASKAATPA